LSICNNFYWQDIRQLVTLKDYKAASQMAVALELFDKQFKLEEFVFPLILEDKVEIAEDFLQRCGTESKGEAVKWLDNLVNEQMKVIRFLQAFN